MSLLISNLATDNQQALLQKLEYIGTGKYAIEKLSVTQAAELIDELLEEQRLIQRSEHEFDSDR